MAETVAVSIRLPRSVHGQILTEIGINNQSPTAPIQNLSTWVLGAVIARLKRAAYRRRVRDRNDVMNETAEVPELDEPDRDDLDQLEGQS